MPREQRRAAAQAPRESAEKRLREVLDPRRRAEFAELSPALKLVRRDD